MDGREKGADKWEDRENEEISDAVGVKGKSGQKAVPSLNLVKTSLCWLRERRTVRRPCGSGRGTDLHYQHLHPQSFVNIKLYAAAGS